MPYNRIRELRKRCGLHQVALGIILGTTQQTISRIESGTCDIPTDLLIKVAKYFNVTTDYILGISDIMQNETCHVRLNNELEEYYDIAIRYKKLNNINRKTFYTLLERLEQAQNEDID